MQHVMQIKSIAGGAIGLRARHGYQVVAFEAEHRTHSVARESGSRKLVLTHLSSRYDADPGTLLKQAKEETAEVAVAYDGYSVEVTFES